jgi:hypothetical protein
MPIGDKEIYRKLWWTIFQQEVFTAMEFGRPSMIRSEDYDQERLVSADFLNLNCSPDKIVRQDYCILNAELSQIALDVLGLSAPRAVSSNYIPIEGRLAEFAVKLPFDHDFWSCQLRVNYNLTVLILHRNRRSPDSVLLAREAASGILTTFETMTANGSIRKCSFHCTTAFLAAAIQFSQDVKSSMVAVSLMRALSAHAQLGRLLRCMEACCEYWPQVNGMHKLCTNLDDRCSRLIKDTTEQRNSIPVASDYTGNVDIPWQDIIAGYHLPDLGLDFDTQHDWLSTF